MDRVVIMDALFALLQSTLKVDFTGDLVNASDVVANIAPSTAGMFSGMAVFGPGVTLNTVVLSVDSETQITLTQAVTVSATGASMTQGFLEMGQRLKAWTAQDVQFPALFLRRGPETYPAHNDMVYAKPILEADVWIYIKAGQDPDADPARALDFYIDALEQVLRPSGADEALQQQTLGGLVQHCWIEGRVDKDPGDTGDFIAKAIVPLRMLVPDDGPFL